MIVMLDAKPTAHPCGTFDGGLVRAPALDTGRSPPRPRVRRALIELHQRIARGFRNRDNYRLRMLLIGGGLTSPHLK
jgi:hypothetical protein